MGNYDFRTFLNITDTSAMSGEECTCDYECDCEYWVEDDETDILTEMYVY